MMPIICKKEVEAILEKLLERYRREKISGGAVSFPESQAFRRRLLGYRRTVKNRSKACRARFARSS